MISFRGPIGQSLILFPLNLQSTYSTLHGNPMFTWYVFYGCTLWVIIVCCETSKEYSISSVFLYVFLPQKCNTFLLHGAVSDLVAKISYMEDYKDLNYLCVCSVSVFVWRRLEPHADATHSLPDCSWLRLRAHCAPDCSWLRAHCVVCTCTHWMVLPSKLLYVPLALITLCYYKLHDSSIDVYSRPSLIQTPWDWGPFRY